MPSISTGAPRPARTASSLTAPGAGAPATLPTTTSTESASPAPALAAFAPEADAAKATGRRAFNPVLALLNRFGTVAPMSAEQRENDLAFRAERAQAFTVAFPKLVASKAPFHALLQEAHHTLNEGKQFSMVVRLSSLLLRNNLQNQGQMRTGPNRAGPYVAPAARDVRPLMEAFGGTMDRLIGEAGAKNDDEGARLAAAWALTVMIRIHPFMDGNGRTARAAMNLTLAKAGQKTIDFPTDSEGVYKQSIVWRGLKDHMRGFVGEGGVGWSMHDGIVPPVGYSERLNKLLGDELRSTTLQSLGARADIRAIADALGHVRAHGF